MTDRREFLQSASLSALALASGVPSIVRASNRAPMPLGAVLIDDRNVESRTFGDRLGAHGAAVRAVPEGDITDLWLHEIGPAWNRRAMAVAGLTQRPALFCLEQLAWAHGLRVVFHAEHIIDPSGVAQHQIFRCSHSGRSGLTAGELARFDVQWPERVADAIAEQSRRPRHERAGPTCAGLEPLLAPDAQLLTSWIIAAV